MKVVKCMKVLKTFGPIILLRKTFCLMRMSIKRIYFLIEAATCSGFFVFGLILKRFWLTAGVSYSHYPNFICSYKITYSQTIKFKSSILVPFVFNFVFIG